MGSPDGTFRARDVEFELKGCSIDPRLQMVLCKIAEQSHVAIKGMAELAGMMDQLTGNIEAYLKIAENMKHRTDMMNRAYNEIPEDVRLKIELEGDE